MRWLMVIVLVSFLCPAPSTLALHAAPLQTISPSTSTMSLSEAISDLTDLFARFGKLDQGITWEVVSDKKIAEIKGIFAKTKELRDLEDWSFIDTDDCSLWLSNDNKGLHLYKIPLAKLRTASLTAESECGECEALMELRTISNEHAIKHLTLFDFGGQLNANYALADENFILLSMSGKRPLADAANDLKVAVKACQASQSQ